MPVASRLPVPMGAFLGLLVAFSACRARVGDRCVCAEDCLGGLACVAEGRVLEAGECVPVSGENSSPAVCVDDDQVGNDDGSGGPPGMLMDLGSKRDFDPGLPPDPADSGSGSGSGSGSDTGTGSGSSSGPGSGSSTGSGSGSSSGPGTTTGDT